jgi:hypothetical protein
MGQQYLAYRKLCILAGFTPKSYVKWLEVY